MFDLDLGIIRFLYLKCKIAGAALGYGAFEGAVIYIGVIAYAFFKGSKNNVR